MRWLLVTMLRVWARPNVTVVRISYVSPVVNSFDGRRVRVDPPRLVKIRLTTVRL